MKINKEDQKRIDDEKEETTENDDTSNKII